MNPKQEKVMTDSPRKFDSSEMSVVLEDSGVEVRREPAGEDMTLVWVKVPSGFDFGPALQGLPHDMCPCEHWGVITDGQMDIRTHDGHELSFRSGQAFHLLPGHMPSFPEACSWYEFTPTDQVGRLFTHMGLA